MSHQHMCMNLNQYTADCESICQNLETIGLPYCDSFRFILSIGKCTFAIPSPCAWKLAFHLWESVCHLSPDWAVTRPATAEHPEDPPKPWKIRVFVLKKLLNFCGVSFLSGFGVVVLKRLVLDSSSGLQGFTTWSRSSGDFSRRTKLTTVVFAS